MLKLSYIFDLLFPVDCLGCGRAGEWWCKNCSLNLKIAPKYCVNCKIGRGYLCAKCRPILGLNDLAVALDYRQNLVRRSIQVLKFYGVSAVAEFLAKSLLDASQILSGHDWLVVPIPVTDKKRRQRGFNQSELLAKPLAANRGWDYQPTILQRANQRRSQVGLDRQQRLKNLKNCFIVKQNLKNKNIILIDDVLTTGATLTAAAQALRLAGVARVSAIVVAHDFS